MPERSAIRIFILSDALSAAEDKNPRQILVIKIGVVDMDLFEPDGFLPLQVMMSLDYTRPPAGTFVLSSCLACSASSLSFLTSSAAVGLSEGGRACGCVRVHIARLAKQRTPVISVAKAQPVSLSPAPLRLIL